MNNGWNHLVYKLWAPIYDYFFNSGMFFKARQSVFKDVVFHEGDRVLFVGVGTGADIEQVPYGKLNITAIDFSEEMLNQACQKFADSKIDFQQMDAQKLTFESNTYDYVVLSLILTVVSDSQKAFEEAIRVTKSGGEILVFDKFVSTGKRLSPIKRIIRPLIRLMGTDIGVSFERLHQDHSENVIILDDQGLILQGMYRKIRLKKK